MVKSILFKGKSRFFQLFALFIAILSTPILNAQADETYVVRGIEVQHAGKNATKAKHVAFLNGQRDAAEKLLRQLSSAGEKGDLPKLSDEDIARMVLSVEVEEERISGTTYWAKLAIHFNPTVMRGFMRHKNLSVSDTPSLPKLILPLYRNGHSWALWGEGLMWRDVWEHSPKSRLTRLVLPLGDLKDISSVSVNDALTGNSHALMGIAKRYKADEVIVAVAEYEHSLSQAMGRNALRIVLNRFAVDGRSTSKSFVVSAPLGTTERAMLEKAVREIIRAFEEGWKLKVSVDIDKQQTLRVKVPVDALGTWVRIRSNLQQATTIDKVQLISLTPKYALVDLGYRGDLTRLNLGLAPYQLRVVVHGAETILEDLTRPETTSDDAHSEYIEQFSSRTKKLDLRHDRRPLRTPELRSPGAPGTPGNPDHMRQFSMGHSSATPVEDAKDLASQLAIHDELYHSLDPVFEQDSVDF